jgi:integrase
MIRTRKPPANRKKLHNYNALKSKESSYPQATKSVTVGNLSASVSGDVAMSIAKTKRIGRRTGKNSDKSIHREHFGQALPAIEAAPQPASAAIAEKIYWDSELPGFGVRSYATGHRAYVVQYRERGKTRRRTLAEVEEIETRTVRRHARKILSTVQTGLGVEDPFRVVVDSSAFRFADLAPLYLASEERRWKEATCKTTRRMIDNFFVPEFGATAVCDITREMVMNWFDGMSDRPAIANRGMPVLSGMMKFAETQKLRPRNSNPCRNITRYKANNRIRFLSMEELARLGEALVHFDKTYPDACAVVRLLLLTGARSDEIEGLEPDEIDEAFFHLKDSKNGPRPVYVGKAVQAVIKRVLIDRWAPWVFPRPYSKSHFEMPSAVWNAIRQRAKLEDFRLHDLRHTFASYSVMNGVSMPTVSRLLGHGILESTERYAHLSNDSVRAAAGRVVGHMARATGFRATGAGK